MTQIDHAKATEVAQGFILIEKMFSSKMDEIDLDALSLSRAYLARSEELAKVAAENARLREALAAAKLVIESDAASSLPSVLRTGLMVAIRAALDARGGA